MREEDYKNLIRNLNSFGCKTYWDYLRSTTWQDKRNNMLEMFPNCYKCGKTSTQVHHKNYKRLSTEPQKDLLTLCGNCHKEIHNG